MESVGDPKDIFEQTSKVENDHNDNSRSIDKCGLINGVLHASEKECMSVLTS